MFLDLIGEILTTLPYALEETVDTVGDAYVRHVETPFVRFTTPKGKEPIKGKVKTTGTQKTGDLKPYNMKEAMSLTRDPAAFEEYMRTHTADGKQSVWDKENRKKAAQANSDGKDKIKEMILESLENLLPEDVELDRDKVEDTIDSLLSIFEDIDIQIGERVTGNEDALKAMLKGFGIDVESFKHQAKEEAESEEDSEEESVEEDEDGEESVNEDFVNDVILAVAKNYKAAEATKKKMYDIMMSNMLSDEFFDEDVNDAAEKLANMMNLQKRKPAANP